MLKELGGPVVGVIVLLDRHVRDAPDVARRHDAPLLVPPGRWRTGHQRPRGAHALTQRVEGCPFRFFPVVERDGAWLEHALWWEAAGVLVVAEAVGTTDYCTLGTGAPLGIHPALRFGIRRSGLSELSHRPTMLLVGHGDLVRGDGGDLTAQIRGAARHGPRRHPEASLACSGVDLGRPAGTSGRSQAVVLTVVEPTGLRPDSNGPDHEGPGPTAGGCGTCTGRCPSDPVNDR
ncbi:MAG: hypothetical protein JWN72_1783 [Thermoleophilia bacterium]|nr:hypothetical protein [Thermoleophilia bacterium]